MMTELLRKEVRTGECRPGCGACCEFLELVVHNVYLEEDKRKWLALHGITLYIGVDRLVMARIPLPCQALKADKSCAVHGTDEKPDICKVWPTSRADQGILQGVCSYGFIPADVAPELTTRADAQAQEES